MADIAGGANPPRPSQVTSPLGALSSVDRSQSRNPPAPDGRPTSPPHLTPTPSASSSDVYELRQMVAGLQSHNSQLMHTTKQQQMTIAQLEVCTRTCWAFTYDCADDCSAIWAAAVCSVFGHIALQGAMQTPIA